jgi:hypothetical protein
VSTDTYFVKIFSLTAIFAAILLQGCGSDRPTPDPLQAERDKLEKERAAVSEERTRMKAEQELAEKKAAADAEAKRLAEARVALEADREKLLGEQSKLEKERANKDEADAIARRDMAERLGLQNSALDSEHARRDEERQQLDALKAQTENDRMVVERANAEAKAREASAKRAEAEAASLRSVAFFHEPLAQYGDWLESDRFGYVWRPKRAEIDKDWRPYADGRWQWTDYGWTWQSLEPFGWATYHYGRWMRHPRIGWLWISGHEWAPAWVSWRVKGSELIGWAPLPPDSESSRGYGVTVDSQFEIGPGNYVFLEVKDFDEPTYLHKFVERDRRMEAIRGSRNVTYMSYRKMAAGNMLVAGGPDPAMIATVIREFRNNPDVQPVPLLTLALANKPVAKETGDIVEAGALLLFAPRLEKGVAKSKPKEIRDRVSPGEWDRGYADSPPDLEAEWRGMIAREAAMAAAAEKAAREPRQVRANVRPVAAAPIPTPTPAPRPAARPAGPPARPHPLNPARLQPAGPLFRN